MPRNILFIFILLYSFFTEVQAQSFSIKGRIDGYTNDQLFLISLYGNKTTNIDTAITDQAGNFIFIVPETTHIGLLKIYFRDPNTNMLNNERGINIIFNKENVNFTSNFTDLYRQLVILESEENKLYYSVLTKHLNNFYAFETAKNKLSYYAETDSFYKNIVKYHNETLLNANTQLNEMLKGHEDKYAYVLLSTYRIPWMDASLSLNPRTKQLIENYFSNLDFSTSSLLYSDIIPTKIMEFFNVHGSLQFIDEKDRSDTYKKATEIILFKAFDNPEIYDFVLGFLLNTFEKYHEVELVKYLTFYIESNKCHSDKELTENERLILNSIHSVEGATVNNFSFQDILTEKKYSLYDIKSDYTLIVFWGQFCEHCKLTMPKLKELYDRYNRNELSVVAISLDTEEPDYIEYLKTNEMIDWYNSCDFIGWEGPLAKTFGIRFTPMFILLDKSKKIIARTEFAKLESLLPKK